MLHPRLEMRPWVRKQPLRPHLDSSSPSSRHGQATASPQALSQCLSRVSCILGTCRKHTNSILRHHVRALYTSRSYVSLASLRAVTIVRVQHIHSSLQLRQIARSPVRPAARRLHRCFPNASTCLYPSSISKAQCNVQVF